jgi:hypothetical protein
MSGRQADDDIPRWLYLVGVALILFVIYVWNAPLEWLSDFISDRMRDGVEDLTPQAPTTDE